MAVKVAESHPQVRTESLKCKYLDPSSGSSINNLNVPEINLVVHARN